MNKKKKLSEFSVLTLKKPLDFNSQNKKSFLEIVFKQNPSLISSFQNILNSRTFQIKISQTQTTVFMNIHHLNTH